MLSVVIRCSDKSLVFLWELIVHLSWRTCFFLLMNINGGKKDLIKKSLMFSKSFNFVSFVLVPFILIFSLFFTSIFTILPSSTVILLGLIIVYVFFCVLLFVFFRFAVVPAINRTLSYLSLSIYMYIYIYMYVYICCGPYNLTSFSTQ